MVQHSDYPNDLALDVIEDAVAPVYQAADRRLHIQTKRARMRVPPEQLKGSVEAPEIILGNGFAEGSDAIL